MELAADTIALLSMVAAIAGFIDALAGGGGLLTLPALLATGIPPVAALATNKLQSTLGTGGAFYAFWRKGHIDFRRFAWPAVGAFLGALMGGAAVQFIDPSFLHAMVPLMLIGIGVYFLLAPKMSEADRHAILGPRGLAGVACIIGFYDGFFGPGTGSFFTTALVMLGGLGLVRAIAHTKMLNFLTNIAALIAMISGGHVLWLLGGSMAIGNIIGNQLGAHTAMRFSGRGVRPLLVIMSFALTIKLLSNPANPLRHWLGV
jgi:hypothetical protein